MNSQKSKSEPNKKPQITTRKSEKKLPQPERKSVCDRVYNQQFLEE